MYLTTADQNDTAALIAKWVRENTTGYGTAVAKAGRSGCRTAAVAAIVKNGDTACTAKVAVLHDRIVYVSKLCVNTSYPASPEAAGRIVGALLSAEED